MADFLTSLWESIFTAGPTPTLLIAANASFAALQAVFLALLIATYSIHFVVLSFLCGGLWWAINWFAAELGRAEEVERDKREKERERREKGGGDSGDDEEEVEEDGMTETETETEVDTSMANILQSGHDKGQAADTGSATQSQTQPPHTKPAHSASGSEASIPTKEMPEQATTGTSTGAQTLAPTPEVMRKRGSELDFSEMSASTGTDIPYESCVLLKWRLFTGVKLVHDLMRTPVCEVDAADSVQSGFAGFQANKNLHRMPGFRIQISKHAYNSWKFQNRKSGRFQILAQSLENPNIK
ncbi:Pkr1-domain-containing protein [Aulographum hederae CBS 113979]|uniref:Pkr1-domain-containing protein n=1 Tax=Aulographum hederae CBS 113979 TaxID=1176131 RepID=A0A6G1H584_9PEZI|nr:Pkr1-domain-containing protein [Aulographum hederae CBS 113979]